MKVKNKKSSFPTPVDSIIKKTVKKTKINLFLEIQKMSDRLKQMERILENIIDVKEYNKKRKRYEKEIKAIKNRLKKYIDIYVVELTKNSQENSRKKLIETFKVRNISIPENLKENK